MKLFKTSAYLKLSARFNLHWKQELDEAIAYMLKEDSGDWMESLDPYSKNEHASQDNKEVLVRQAVEDWLLHQPQQVKLMNGDLDPDFKGQVQSYVMSKYNVDPFPGAVEELQVPSDEDLESWWK